VVEIEAVTTPLALASIVALTTLGCTPGGGGSGRDSGEPDGEVTDLPTITVSGRVVDYESCFEGCVGVENVAVAWGGAPMVLRSEPSGADGSFTLAGVPSGIRSDLIAIPEGPSGSSFATTLNAMLVRRDQTSDVFALQVAVLPRDAQSIIAAFEAETGIRLDRDGGYIGQVVNADNDAVAGVDVAYAPAQGTIRYVDAVPRYAPTEPAFQPPEATSTSIFGVFVLGGSGSLVDPVTFAPGTPPMAYQTIVTPLIPGVVSFGIHPPR
jgi:hypothetical protein